MATDAQNSLLKALIDYGYLNDFLTDSEADTLEQAFLGDWAED